MTIQWNPFMPLQLIFIYLMIIFITIIIGKMWNHDFGPVLHKDAVAEERAKREVLVKNDLIPNENNRKFKWFGLFSWIDDEVTAEELRKFDPEEEL